MQWSLQQLSIFTEYIWSMNEISLFYSIESVSINSILIYVFLQYSTWVQKYVDEFTIRNELEWGRIILSEWCSIILYKRVEIKRNQNLSMEKRGYFQSGVHSGESVRIWYDCLSSLQLFGIHYWAIFIIWLSADFMVCFIYAVSKSE